MTIEPEAALAVIVPWLFSVRSSKSCPVLMAKVAPLATVVVPLPDMVPLVQLDAQAVGGAQHDGPDVWLGQLELLDHLTQAKSVLIPMLLRVEVRDR